MATPDKVSTLDVSVNGAIRGQLSKASNYEFYYQGSADGAPSVSLRMPARERQSWRDGAIFPVMDQNLPEGDLLLRLSALLPKQRLQPMHLLAMIREGGIGQVGYAVPDAGPALMPEHIERHTLLSLPF
jgi:serine/threonine-protein kinase HipA